MKELMTVFAACAIAGAAVAVDSNIVGYQMHNLKAGPNLMGVAWEAVDVAGQPIGLADIMDISQLTSINEDGDVYGDYVNVWNIGSGWDANVYYYVDQPSWNEPGLNYEKTWMDGDFQPCNPTLDAGQAFWLFLKANISDFPFKGQVAENGSLATLTTGPNLIANPIPRDINLSNASVVAVEGATSVNEDGDIFGDYVNVWNIGSGWEASVYYYVDQPSWNEPGLNYEKTWMDGDFTPGVASIPAGSAFWYFAKDAGVEVTFKAL